MIIALFMMLALSVLGTSLMIVSQTETDSSHNYRLMSQARYGAESGIHKATNYLLNTYVPPAHADAADPSPAYNTTVSPVTWNNAPVVLSSDAASVQLSRLMRSRPRSRGRRKGTLDVKDATVALHGHGHAEVDAADHRRVQRLPVTIQTWEITGDGNITGATTAQVEVVGDRRAADRADLRVRGVRDRQRLRRAVVRRRRHHQQLRLDARAGRRVLRCSDDSSGNVGTNGNLDGKVVQPTIITDRCRRREPAWATARPATSRRQPSSGGATVQDGLNQLSQPVNYPTPAAINPLPPTTATDFKQEHRVSGRCGLLHGQRERRDDYAAVGRAPSSRWATSPSTPARSCT